jgi:hypothetical protein
MMMMYPDAQDWCDAPFFPEDVLLDIEKKTRIVIDDYGWQSAQVFNRKKGRHVRNTDVRRHSKHVIDDKDTCRQVTQPINEALSRRFPDDSFWLRDSHIDILYYKEGDFFRRHEDFIKYYFPDVRLYVLLIGLQTCHDGGETVLYTTAEGTPHFGSVRRNRACFFPAHIPHESRVVKKGEKLCLKVDVFFVQRYVLHKKITCRVGDSLFSFLDSWFDGFESFLTSMCRFQDSRELEITSIDEDTFRLFYRIFVHDYSPTKTEKEHVEKIWDMFFPDLSIVEMKTWTTFMGWFRQPSMEKHSNTCIWTRDVTCFFRFYQTYVEQICPFIAFRYRDTDRRTWNVFSILPLFSDGVSCVTGHEHRPSGDGWTLHPTGKFYYNKNIHEKQEKQVLNIDTLVTLKRKHQSAFIKWCDFSYHTDVFHYTLSEKNIDSTLYCIGQKIPVMTDAFSLELYTSVIDHHNIFDFHENGVMSLIEGTSIEEYREWCNDDYGPIEFQEKYRQYEFDCVYGFVKLQNV